MTATAFIDTNLLLYAGSNAREDQAKRAIAHQVLSQSGIGFSAQVMQEFYAAAVTKQRL
jgi:predicted nucleic acid-binding protein